MAIEAGMLLRYILSILFYCRDTPLQGDFNCSSLSAGLGGNGEFERKFEGIREKIIQNEVSLGGSPTIKVTLLHSKHQIVDKDCCSIMIDFE